MSEGDPTPPGDSKELDVGQMFMGISAFRAFASHLETPHSQGPDLRTRLGHSPHKSEPIVEIFHLDTVVGVWLQMLLFCFLRMSMVVPDVNLALWEALMQLMHSLTHWKEVIEQWKVRSGCVLDPVPMAPYM